MIYTYISYYHINMHVQQESEARDPNLRASCQLVGFSNCFKAAKAEGEVVVDDTTSSWHTVRPKQCKQSRLKETGFSQDVNKMKQVKRTTIAGHGTVQQQQAPMFHVMPHGFYG